MSKRTDLLEFKEEWPRETDRSKEKEELEFWEGQKRFGDEIDLKLARDLPDDTPEFILKMMCDFESEASRFCFSGASGRVLDAGCGNGNLIMKALENSGIEKVQMPSWHIIGMDFSKNMLARAALRAANDDRAGFLQGSVTNLPFSDQSFDRVVCSGVLTCLPNYKAAARALQEFYRVLKPEGILAVDFFSRISHYTLIRKHLFRELINPPEYMSPAEFQGALQEAGFAVLSYRGFDFKPCQGYLFLSRWRTIIDPGYFQERLSRFVENQVLPRRQRLNLLGYRIYVKCIKK